MLFFFRKARLQRLSRSLTTQRARQWTRRRLRTECTSSVLRTSRLSADRRNTSPSLSSMKSQDGQAQLRRTGFRWIKACALLEPLQELRGQMEAPSIDHPEAIAAAMLFRDAINGKFDDPTDAWLRHGEAVRMNTARSATADAFARAPLPKRFCNLD